jgi:hypothetical protein
MRLPPGIKIRFVEFGTRSKILILFTLESTAAGIILCRIILSVTFIKSNYLMLYRANLAACGEICEKRRNAMRVQNAEFLNVEGGGT